MTPEEIREKMVLEWGLSEFPKEKQDEFIDQIGQALMGSIMLRATGSMDEAALEKFDTFMQNQGETPDLTASLKYLSENVPNFDNVVREETAKLKERVAMPA